jgi:hypothetical protein
MTMSYFLVFYVGHFGSSCLDGTEAENSFEAASIIIARHSIGAQRVVEIREFKK